MSATPAALTAHKRCCVSNGRLVRPEIKPSAVPEDTLIFPAHYPEPAGVVVPGRQAERAASIAAKVTLLLPLVPLHDAPMHL
jgi:hypothetical protein